MTKMKKVLSIITATCILFGNVAVCSATSAGITASVTKETAKASYSYGNGGNRVTVKMYYWETHSSTGQTYNNHKDATVNGNYTTASATKNADLGYNFDYIKVKGYLNGVLQATLKKLEV